MKQKSAYHVLSLTSLGLLSGIVCATPSLSIETLYTPAYMTTAAGTSQNPAFARRISWNSPDVGAGIALDVQWNLANTQGAGFEIKTSTAKFELTYNTGVTAPETYATGSSISYAPLTLECTWLEYRSEYLGANDHGGGPANMYGIATVRVPDILTPFTQLYYGNTSDSLVHFANLRIARKLTNWTVASDRSIVSKVTFAPLIPRISATVVASQAGTVSGYSTATVAYDVVLSGFQANGHRYFPFSAGASETQVSMAIDDGSSVKTYNSRASGGQVDCPGDLVNGSYVVTISRPGMLTRIRSFTVSNNEPTLSSALDLRVGDTDDSGEIDAADIDNVIAAFGLVEGDSGWFDGTYPAYLYTDVDGSGEVDAADSDVVTANYGQVSD